MTGKKLDPVIFSCMLGVYSSVSLLQFQPQTDLTLDISDILSDVHDVLLTILEENQIQKSKIQNLLDKSEEIIHWTDMAIRHLNPSNE